MSLMTHTSLSGYVNNYLQVCYFSSYSNTMDAAQFEKALLPAIYDWLCFDIINTVNHDRGAVEMVHIQKKNVQTWCGREMTGKTPFLIKQIRN